MKVSTKGRYALRMMIDLAQCDPQQYISLRDISRRQDISMKYMEQIVSALVRAGYVDSVRGPRGGYRLAKPPEEYRAGDILRVTEGTLAPVWCVEEDSEGCPREEGCGARPFWDGLYKCINEYVYSYTLRDLL